MEYRYGSHTVFQIEYHFVWVTKYRYKVLTGDVAERVRDLVRETCEAFEIRISGQEVTSVPRLAR
jgi:putative transposase